MKLSSILASLADLYKTPDPFSIWLRLTDRQLYSVLFHARGENGSLQHEYIEDDREEVLEASWEDFQKSLLRTPITHGFDVKKGYLLAAPLRKRLEALGMTFPKPAPEPEPEKPAPVPETTPESAPRAVKHPPETPAEKLVEPTPSPEKPVKRKLRSHRFMNPGPKTRGNNGDRT